MNKNKNKKFIIAKLIILVIILFILLVLYAKFTVNNTKNINSVESLLSKTEIVYDDNNNITIIDLNDKNYTKKFTIKNISSETIYYDITLNNIVNNYCDKQNIVYKLKSTNNGAYVDEKELPSTYNETIASNIKLESNSIHEYIITIYNIGENNDNNKVFSSDINFEETKKEIIENEKYDNNTIFNLLLKNNTIESEEKIENNSNGLYYTNNSNNGRTIYFFKGNNTLNNNLILGDTCYKIIRTTENNGVRLIYNGKYENNICSSNKNIDDKIQYNTRSSYNAYVGFMYGNASSSNYDDEHANKNSSNIKILLEKYYVENLTKYDNIISDSIYCNNRETSSFVSNSIKYSTLGYSNNNTGYISTFNNYLKRKKPTYYCKNILDRFSTNENNGNGYLEYSIGLITLDELIYAGFDKNSYLYYSKPYYTMTPAYYNGSGAYVFEAGTKISVKKVDETSGLRPVITIKGNTIINNGDGSKENPYFVNIGEVNNEYS